MLSVILNEIRSYFRNGSNIFFTVFFPSICVFFLGTFLENIEVSDAVIGDIKLLYGIESADSYSAFAFEEFIGGLTEADVLTAEKTDAGAESFDPAEYSALVVLNGTELSVYGGSNSTQNRTIKAILDGYNRTASAYFTVAVNDPAALASIRTADREYVSQKDLGTNRSMMDYYAITMTVLIVFMGTLIGGASAYSDEYRCSTILRLNASPVSPMSVYFGKIIGNFPMVLIQVLTVLLFSTFFFGAHFCASVWGNVLLAGMLIAASLAALALGMLINLFFPRFPATSVLMPTCWLMMFFSGTFQKDIHIDGVTEFLPMYVIQQAAFDLTVFSRPEAAIRVTLLSLCLLILFVGIGSAKVRFGKREI